MGAIAHPTRPLRDSDIPSAHALHTALQGTIPVSGGGAGRQAHPGTTLWAACHEGRPVAMATLHVLPEMTWSARPCAPTENVVIAATQHGRGYGRAVMVRAIAAAWGADCCKIMPLTGQRAGMGAGMGAGMRAGMRAGMGAGDGPGADAGARAGYGNLGFADAERPAMVPRGLSTRRQVHRATGPADR